MNSSALVENSSRLACVTLLCALSQVACMAALGGEPGGEDGSSPASPEGGDKGSSAKLPDLTELDCTSAPRDPGQRVIPLLSRRQYLNTLTDLVGDVPGVEDALAAYVPPSSLGVPRAPVGATDVEGFHRAAEVIAARVVSDTELLTLLAPCPPESDRMQCARAFIETFGGRAYRAPLLDEEDISRHLDLFAVGNATSYERGIELLIRGIMQAPRFLYQLEIGTTDAVSQSAVRLRPRELAARLSYTIWDAPPDQALLDAADAGALDDEAGLAQQAERLLADERGQPFVRHFLEEWTHTTRVLSVAKSETHYPAWPSIQQATHAQALSFFDHVLKEEGGTLSALLTSRTVMVDEILAPHYGVTGVSGFSAFEAPRGEPAGLLTLPAVLATFAKADESSPVHRGVFVREGFFCETPPAPPADIPPAPEVDSGGSTRDRLAQHVADPACAGCHKLIDPVGLGLEHYDAMGLYRSEDDGRAVDASGELIGTDVDGPFTGAVELGERLLESDAVQQCLTRQWFRYAISRVEDDDYDLCTIKDLLTSFRAAGQSLNALPQAVIATDAFRFRRPSDAEISP